jgi:hypothetical protein
LLWQVVFVNKVSFALQKKKQLHGDEASIYCKMVRGRGAKTMAINKTGSNKIEIAFLLGKFMLQLPLRLCSGSLKLTGTSDPQSGILEPG